MNIYLENNNFKLIANKNTGMIEGFYSKKDKGGGSFLLSSDLLEKEGFSKQNHRLLGSSIFQLKEDNKKEEGLIETGSLPLQKAEFDDNRILFTKEASGLQFTYKFALLEDGLTWEVLLENKTEKAMTLKKLAHWIPISYLCGKDIDYNLIGSWSMVPSMEVSKPYIICKKRNGQGPDYIVRNTTGGMKSVGSACDYRNLFFEKASPSLSGVVLFNAALCWEGEKEDSPLIDWQYKDLYKEIKIEAKEEVKETFEIRTCDPGKAEEKLINLGTGIVDFPPYSIIGESASLRVRGGRARSWKSIYVPEKGDHPEIEKEGKGLSVEEIEIGPFKEAGERKVEITLEDGGKYSVIFPVYTSMKDYIEKISNYIYENRFIEDSKDPDQYGYRSVSPQGESCGKGSVLLLKNSLVAEPIVEEIKQVEINTVKYILPTWLDKDLEPKRKYGSGSDKFVRMYDIEYIIVQLYLLGTFPDHLLSMNKAKFYIELAGKLLRYRIEPTSDKNHRELEETYLAMTCHWDMDDLLERYATFGNEKEVEKIKELLKSYIEKQKETLYSGRSMVTEIFFDNAGVAMSTGCLLSLKEKELGLEAAKLLLPNVAPSNDYRCYAPDRWWEAQAPMYHNLWAANVAKAMLQAYEAGGGEEYLIASYRSMMPLFYNYDWKVRSARRTLKVGEGVSTYCISSPNLNHEPCSHNRFGQQIFVNDSFIRRLKLHGDDWDNGIDLVIYLQSFGQSCYLEGSREEPYVVGGNIKRLEEGYLIHSYSAYPVRYYLKPWNMIIERSSNSYTIDQILIKDGECKNVYICGEVPKEKEFLWMKKDGAKEKIYPEFIKN